MTRVLRKISRGFVFGGMGCIFSMVLLITADILKRNLQGESLFGTTEISTMLIAVGVAFGFAWTQVQRQHVATEFIFQRFSPRWQSVTSVFDHSFAFLLSGFLAYVSWIGAWERYVEGETYFAGNWLMPVWPARFLFAMGITLLCLVLLQDLIMETRSVVRKRRIAYL